MNEMAPEKLDAQTIDMQRSSQFLFLTSLLHFRSGWFANHALSLGRDEVGANRKGSVGWPATGVL